MSLVAVAVWSNVDSLAKASLPRWAAGCAFEKVNRHALLPVLYLCTCVCMCDDNDDDGADWEKNELLCILVLMCHSEVLLITTRELILARAASEVVGVENLRFPS